MSSSLHRLLLLCCALGLLLCAQGVRALATSTTLISRAPGGNPATTGAETRQVAVSDDGRYAAFLSNATSYGGNPEGRWQVYLRDRQTGQVTLVSRSTAGSPADRDCVRLAMSRDGRYVAFASEATNLAPGTVYAATAVYLHDVSLGKTELVSQSNLGAPPYGKSGASGLAVSADGRFVAFSSDATLLVADDTNQVMDVFIRDRAAGLTERVSRGAGVNQANAFSGYGGVGVSDDGRFVVYASVASNLVAGDGNQQSDVFLRDRLRGVTERASVADDGSEADGPSGSPSISADGSRVAFTSDAADLVPADTNGVRDAFVRDRAQGTTRRVSLNADGTERRAHSEACALSPDGAAVGYWIAPAPEFPWYQDSLFNSYADVFIHEIETGTTEWVSAGLDGRPSSPLTAFGAPLAVSSGGRFVGWISLAANLAAGDDNHRHDAFLRDRALAITDWISAGPVGAPTIAGARSTEAAVSPDGRFVAFTSDATDLVPGDTNGMVDVFVWDRQSGAIERVSVASDGGEGNGRSGDLGGATAGPAISADGRFVAFASSANNLVPNDRNLTADTFVRDRLLGVTERVSISNADLELRYGSFAGRPALSADGRFVAFASSSGAGPAENPLSTIQIYVRDRIEGTTERVSQGPEAAWADGNCYDLDLSADGRFVAFSSLASNLVPGDYNQDLDVFVYDRQTTTTEQVNLSSSGAVADTSCYQAGISADGRYVLFLSDASNLVPEDYNGRTDAFVRDRSIATTESASLSYWNNEGSEGTQKAALSPDGRYVAFTSDSDYMVPEDEDGLADVFVRDLDRHFTERVSLATGGSPGNWRSPDGLYFAPAISRGGRYVAFSSDASNLVSDDANGGRDIFIRDRSEEALPAPTSLTAVLVAGDHVSLQWTDESLTEKTFQIERREGDGPFHYLNVAFKNNSRYEDYSVSPAGPYTYRVRAANDALTSGYSNEAVVTYPDLPAAPFGLTVTPRWPTAMALTWSAGSPEVVTFVVERSSNLGGPFSPVRGVAQPAYTDVSVTNSTTYYYRVAATNPRGRSAYTDVVSATSFPYLPSTPSNLRVTRIGEDWVALAWDDYGGVEDGYRIERRSPGGEFAAIGEAGVNEVTFIDRNLPSGTRFEYRVVSFNRSGEAASAIVEATTLPVSGGKLRIPGSVDFGLVPYPTSRTRAVQFRNLSATEPLHVTLTIPEAPFSIQPTERSFVIAPHSFHNVAVTCQPTDRVRTTKRWQGQSGDPKRPFFEIRLSGASKRPAHRD